MLHPNLNDYTFSFDSLKQKKKQANDRKVRRPRPVNYIDSLFPSASASADKYTLSARQHISL